MNEKDKIVNLTQQGVHKVEQFFHIENLADADNLEIQHNVILALRAHYLMFRDQDYVVKDDQVMIVDEFTGRIMPGRRYSDGLHQAIEAKEHVKVKRESKTYVVSLTRAIAQELQDEGSNIYIGALCPGPVNTEFNSVANVEFALCGISPSYCVKYAIRQMKKRKVLIVPTLTIKAATFFGRFIPQSLYIKIAGHQQKKKFKG